MKKFNKKIFWIPLILFGLLFGFYGKTAAKYVSDSFWNYYLKSKGFYFSSEYLSTNGFKNVNNLWDGNSVHFNVKNILNSNVVSDYDISYTATCSIDGDASSYAECRMNGTSSNEYSGVLSNFQSCFNNTSDGINVSTLSKTDCEIGGYDWVSHIVTADLYFEVVVTDSDYELNDVNVLVEVESTSPYRQSLSGEFILHKNVASTDVTFDYIDYSNYGRLTLTNPSALDKCVVVSWNSYNLVIGDDKSIFNSYNADSNGYINEVVFSVDAKKSNSYIFYKRDFTKSYDVEQFNVNNSSDCL